MKTDEYVKSLSEVVSMYKKENRLSPVPALKRIDLELTSDCNMQCIYCYLGKEKAAKRRMSFADACLALDLAKEYQVESIYLTGGEPLLHEQVIEIIEYATKKEFKEVCLVTNGSLIDQDYAKVLYRYPINVAVGTMTHNVENGIRIHGPLFPKMLDGIFNLINAGFSGQGETRLLAAGATIMEANYRDLLAYYEWIKQNGILWSGLEPLICTGNADQEMWPEQAIVDQIMEEIARREGILPADGFLTPFGSPFGCQPYKGRLYVNGALDVKMCGSSDFILGNLHSKEIIDIWENHPVLLALRHFKALSPSVCGRCQYDCIGCPVTTYRLTGDLLSSYPFCRKTKGCGTNP